MTDCLIDLETLPAGAAPGLDLANGPPGWTGPVDRPVERKRRPANITRAETIAAWEAEEDTRHAWAVANDADVQRAEAVAHWRGGSLRWADVRIGCIGWTDGEAVEVFDATQLGEAEALRAMFRRIPPRGQVWSFGAYDARVIRARCLALGVPWGPFSVAAKPWDRRAADLMALAAEVLEGNPKSITGISVDALAAFLRIERPPQIRGAEVLDAYLGGRWGEVLHHCRDDVRVEWAILQALRAAEVAA